MPKTDFEIIVKATDQASGTFGKVDAKIVSLGDRLKALGQSFGSDRISKLGEVTGKADGAGERIGGGLGAAAKVGGALFIGATIGRELQSAADSFAKVKAEAGGADAKLRDLIAGGLRVVPLLGDMVKGFDAIGDTIKGRKGIDELLGEAKIQEANAARFWAGRAASLNVIRDAREAADPSLKIRRSGSDDESAINRSRKLGEISEAEAGAAVAIIRKKTADQLAAIEKASADERIAIARDASKAVAASYTISSDAFDKLSVANRERIGDHVGAEVTAIRIRLRHDLDALADEIKAVRDDPKLDSDKKAARITAINAAAMGTRRVAAGEEGDAIRAGKDRAADTIGRIGQTIIGASDNTAASEGLQRIAILTKYRDLAKEIAGIEREGVLTDEQRKLLAAEKIGLAQAQKDELAKIGERAPISIQGRQVAPALDGRYQVDAIAQRSRIETYPGGRGSAEKSAAETAEQSKLTNDLLKQLIAAMTPVVVG